MILIYIFILLPASSSRDDKTKAAGDNIGLQDTSNVEKVTISIDGADNVQVKGQEVSVQQMEIAGASIERKGILIYQLRFIVSYLHLTLRFEPIQLSKYMA